MAQKITQKVGLIFGKFYPLHLGHLYLIEKAAVQVDVLHVFLGVEAQRDAQLFSKSQLPKAPQVADRLHWLRTIFKTDSSIKIHVLDEANIASYPNGWQDWNLRVQDLMAQNAIKANTIFTSEPQDKPLYEHYFGCKVQLIDVDRDFMPISATKIRNQPYQNWRFMPSTVQAFFSLSIGVVVADNSQIDLVKKLALIFNTLFFDVRDQADFSMPNAQKKQKQSLFVAPFSLYLINELQTKLPFDQILYFDAETSQLETFLAQIKTLQPFNIYKEN